MLRNYFATAIRNLLQHRLHSAINIGGLALGLAACLLILLFVRDELSYDRWLPNVDRIAKLEITFNVPGREPLAFSQTPGPAKAALEKDFASDIERAVRMFHAEQTIRAGDRQFAKFCESRLGEIEAVLVERDGLGRTEQFVPIEVAPLALGARDRRVRRLA